MRELMADCATSLDVEAKATGALATGGVSSGCGSGCSRHRRRTGAAPAAPMGCARLWGMRACLHRRAPDTRRSDGPSDRSSRSRCVDRPVSGWSNRKGVGDRGGCRASRRGPGRRRARLVSPARRHIPIADRRLLGSTSPIRRRRGASRGPAAIPSLAGKRRCIWSIST